MPRPSRERLACGRGWITETGVVAGRRSRRPWYSVDTITLEKAEALADNDLLKAAAIVMEELRRRGMLFAATATIVDWQDGMFLTDSGVES